MYVRTTLQVYYISAVITRTLGPIYKPQAACSIQHSSYFSVTLHFITLCILNDLVISRDTKQNLVSFLNAIVESCKSQVHDLTYCDDRFPSMP